LPNTFFSWTCTVFHGFISNLEYQCQFFQAKTSFISVTLLIIPSRSSSANNAGTIPVVNILLINSKNPLKNIQYLVLNRTWTRICSYLLQQHVDHRTWRQFSYFQYRVYYKEFSNLLENVFHYSLDLIWFQIFHNQLQMMPNVLLQNKTKHKSPFSNNLFLHEAFPLPPTPTNSALPLSIRITRWIRVKCSSASSNRTKFIRVFCSLYSARICQTNRKIELQSSNKRFYFIEYILCCFVILKIFINSRFTHIQSCSIITEQWWFSKDIFTLRFQWCLIVN